MMMISFICFVFLSIVGQVANQEANQGANQEVANFRFILPTNLEESLQEEAGQEQQPGVTTDLQAKVTDLRYQTGNVNEKLSSIQNNLYDVRNWIKLILSEGPKYQECMEQLAMEFKEPPKSMGQFKTTADKAKECVSFFKTFIAKMTEAGMVTTELTEVNTDLKELDEVAFKPFMDSLAKFPDDVQGVGGNQGIIPADQNGEGSPNQNPQPGVPVSQEVGKMPWDHLKPDPTG